MAKRVLLGIDFIGENFPAALYTIQQWWYYVTRNNEQYDCIFGVSNFCNRHASLPGTDVLTPNDVPRILRAFIPEKKLVQWTSDIDADLIAKIEKKSSAIPFFSEFNYGSVINRLLLLATSHDCDYLVRLDPGTLPPKTGITFQDLMYSHERRIASNKYTVVSQCYKNRLALRDMFVKEGMKVKHAELIKEYTGINVDNQITAGAMLTFKIPGVPAPCFPSDGNGALTMVWASDDGIYSILSKTKNQSVSLTEAPIERFDAEGKSKNPIEYYHGILGAVCLKTICDGYNLEQVRDQAQRFLNDLKDIIDPQKCKKIGLTWDQMFSVDMIAPYNFLKNIQIGYQNYSRLLNDWEKICKILGPTVAQKTCFSSVAETGYH